MKMSQSTTPAKATVDRVASELSPLTGRSASAVANAAGLSPSTARKALVALKEQGRARRNDETADWFAISVTTESDAVVERIDEALAEQPEPRREPQPFPGEEEHVPRTTPPRPEVEQANQLAEEGVKAVLSSWGLSEKLVAQDAQLYVTLKQAGPLRRDELEARLSDFSEWSIRRLQTGRHQGRQVGDALIEAVGRGEDKVYQVVG
jgi:hypothetical protein